MKWIQHLCFDQENKLENKKEIICQNKAVKYKANLKSVDGSLPCQPISFHWSDIKPWSSFPGYVADHSALRASCCHENCKLAETKGQGADNLDYVVFRYN